MKTTTTSQDSVKVNQILPIMQEHFGKSINLARIELMTYLLHVLCVVQTVSLHKLADATPTSFDKDSNSDGFKDSSSGMLLTLILSHE